MNQPDTSRSWRKQRQAKSLGSRGGLFCALILVLLLYLPSFALAEAISIGVLAKRGHLKTSERWQPLAQYLTEAIPEHQFSIYPLSFQAIGKAVRTNQVSFVLANSGIYIELEALEKISRIATMKNDIRGNASTTFGSVIFTRADRKDIRTLSDVIGKRVAAVHPISLGGWIMAKREFHLAKIDPHREFGRLDFLGTHDAAVMSVLNKSTDVGIVRTDTLERMADEGKLTMDEIRPIYPRCNENNPEARTPEAKTKIKTNDTPKQDAASDMAAAKIKTGTGIPCFVLRSTSLYPEWPFAKLKTTPSKLAEQVAVALISMPENHPAARKAHIRGWTIPANYQPVHDAFKDLKLGPYAKLNDVSAADFFNKYKAETLCVIGALMVLVVLLLRNISLNYHLRESRERLRHMARYDSLTDLPNRRYFEEFASKQLYHAERAHNAMGLLFIDLDDFKEINDTYGHAAGDQVLIEVASRLTAVVRKGDLVARCGGDEFIILMVNIEGRNDLKDAASRILTNLQKPILFGQSTAVVGGSIGIACYPDDGIDVHNLLKHADAAMYAVKEAGRRDYAFYDKAHHAPNRD